jgi:acetoacetate decarboxylase
MSVSAEIDVEIGAASFGVGVHYDGREGIYPLTMPITSEAAVIAGRERFGEPRKLARIEFELRRERVAARVERMGVEFLAVRAERKQELTPREQTEEVYCFKAFPGCQAEKGFDQDPQLVRLEWRHRFERVVRLEGSLELVDSPFDPVVDLPVRRMVSLEYTEGQTRSSGRVLRPVPGDWLLPFLHQRNDEAGVEGLDV